MIILRAVNAQVLSKVYSSKLWPETEFALIHFLVKKLLCLCTVGFWNQGVSRSSSCDELKNFAANNLL